jgi:hypothetical protein
MIAMTRRLLLATGLACTVLVGTPVLAHESHGKPQHGGVTTDAGGFEWELVLKPTAATLHMSDHGKPLDTKGAKGKLTVLSGGKKTETELVSNGRTLEAKGEFPASRGTKAIAVVTMPSGKPVTARFEMK